LPFHPLFSFSMGQGWFEFFKPHYLQDDPTNDTKCLFGESVSKFSKQHPGGSALIEAGAHAGDTAASLLYLTYHFTKDFDKIEQIAQHRGFSGVSKIQRSALHRELDDILSDVRRKYSVHGTVYRAYCAVLVLLLVYSLFMHCFSGTINPWNSALVGLSWLSYSFSVFHIRHHMGPGFAKSRRLDAALNLIDYVLCDTVTGWIRRHQTNHHLFTNSQLDNDVVQLGPYFYLKGYSEVFDRRFYHKFQSFYAPFLLGISQFDRVWAHLRSFEDGKRLSIPCYYALLIFVPWMVNDCSLMANVANYFAIKFVCGMVTAYLFLVSHNMAENAHSQSIETEDFDKWLASQAAESMSWSNRVNPLNYAITMVVGGINLQIEHHIAPALCPLFYLFASQRIKSALKRHGIEYHEVDNFGAAVYGFHRFIHSVAVE